MTDTLWPSREKAWSLLTEFTQNPQLIKHALAVEAVMRQIALQHGEDVDLFGLVGLLHDFDYERFPEIGQHTIEGGKILAAAGFPDRIIRAIQSHVSENHIPRETLLEKAIFAADELTGFIVAVTLVRPSQSLSEVTAQSVKKKLKDKSFARGVNREEVYAGLSGLGVTLEDFVPFILDALKPHADVLGLNP
ncbi:metal dependent phosphohydrolase [Sulfobacillus acidophilus TPY]|uniref:Metal dependent phosphohydrolase n=1 Tax=Sulfobacillus acidophilus (strain ATCC 700253 / DSM 10332 / NAL) TaxID=679936 RepID=G8TWQ3_SULAD|nr:metal dependent phosphohydrolase [Sulfobacillus acidophilus TPY]AEW06042.1 metal dependent phosphohydrolase [Sulfobacillus acidophilus DSM 10332]